MAAPPPPGGFSIGQVVRVRLVSSASAAASTTAACCRATTLTLNATDDSADVLFEEGLEWAEGKEEEANVPLARLAPLLPFEEQAAAAEDEEAEMSAGQLRECGNQLFATCKDYGAALAWYEKALEKLAPAKATGALRVGTLPLVVRIH